MHSGGVGQGDTVSSCGQGAWGRDLPREVFWRPLVVQSWSPGDRLKGPHAIRASCAEKR